MNTTPNTLPRVQLTRGAFDGLFADVLEARIVKDDGTALLVRAIDGGDVWTLVCDFADVVIVDAGDSEREAA